MLSMSKTLPKPRPSMLPPSFSADVGETSDCECHSRKDGSRPDARGRRHGGIVKERGADLLLRLSSTRTIPARSRSRCSLPSDRGRRSPFASTAASILTDCYLLNQHKRPGQLFTGVGGSLSAGNVPASGSQILGLESATKSWSKSMSRETQGTGNVIMMNVRPAIR